MRVELGMMDVEDVRRLKYNADRSQEVQNTNSLIPTRLQSETQSRITRR